MLRLSNVHWSIGARTILEGVDLTVRSGELSVLLGPSGAGKTTILRLAAGLISPQAGMIQRDFHRTAMVFQEPRLLPWANAIDNVALALAGDGGGRGEQRRQAIAWLYRLGFEDADLTKRPRQLSGGMQARVAIARAFVSKPDLVVMDEPFAALDIGLRRDLQALIRSLVSDTGIAALFVTHDLTEAVRLADHILLLAGQPARIVADLPHQPIDNLPAAWDAAAILARHPEITPVLTGLSQPFMG